MNPLNKALVATGLSLSLFWMACSESGNHHTASSFASRDEAAPASAPESAADTQRVVIQTGEIRLFVKDIEPEMLAIQSSIESLGGHIGHYELQNPVTEQHQVSCSLDSSWVVRTVEPNANLQVRVPAAAADSFIRFILKREGRLEQFLFDEEDVTEQLRSTQDLIALDATKGGTKHTVQNDFQASRQETRIAREESLRGLQYRTRYLWFNIHLDAPARIDRQVVASPAQYDTPFGVKVLQALQKGWQGFSFVLLALLHLWPFLLLALVLFIWVRRQYYLPVKKSLQPKA